MAMIAAADPGIFWIAGAVLLLFGIRVISVIRASAGGSEWLAQGLSAISFLAAAAGLIFLFVEAQQTRSLWFGAISTIVTAWVTFSIENRSSKDFIFGLVSVISALGRRGRSSPSEYTQDWLSTHVVVVSWALIAGGYSYLLIQATGRVEPNVAAAGLIAIILASAFPAFAALVTQGVFRIPWQAWVVVALVLPVIYVVYVSQTPAELTLNFNNLVGWGVVGGFAVAIIAALLSFKK